MKNKYEVLSPDGIRIDGLTESYPSFERALNAFEVWKLRYEVQGYYSANYGRISLNELKNHCTFKLI